MASEAPAVPRRAIPLRDVTLPHRCPRPLRLRVLAATPYFRGLSPEALDGIDARMRSRSWARDDLLYRTGDPADALYVIAHGSVKLTRTATDGATGITDVLAPGQLFGAMGTLGEPTHGHSANALVPTCTLRIGQADFRQVLVELPGVALRVLDDVVARLDRAQTDVGGQISPTVAQRVAKVILRLADTLGEQRGPAGVLIAVPLSRQELAELARSTPESVSRVMSAWKRAGIIDSGRRWTSVLDRRRLEQEAG